MTEEIRLPCVMNGDRASVGMRIVRDNGKAWVSMISYDGKFKFTFGFIRAEDFAAQVPELLKSIPK